jgi:hypothetical protein
MNNDTQNEFLYLRKRLFKAMDKYFEEDTGGCKSYEGAFSIGLKYPDYFEKNDQPKYFIHLDLYVLAPAGRHHEWEGDTIEEALGKCKKDILSWIKEYE